MVSDLQGFTNDRIELHGHNGVRFVTKTLRRSPQGTDAPCRSTTGQWTSDAWTLQGALRFDRNWSLFPDRASTDELLSTPSFPERLASPAYKEITAGGVAYDVFGNGKTSLKVNFGKYLEPTSNNNNYILSNPIGRIATNAARSWTDNNNNFAPDCDLRSPAAQSPTTTGSIDTCGAMNNQTFGTTALTTAAIDPKILEGWSVRSNDWRCAPRSI